MLQINKQQKQKTILVIDDTIANLTLMRNLLEPEGYKILVATSGEKALTLLNKVVPDLILLDVMMPSGIDGFETLKQIKLKPQFANLPVIFVTAMADIEKVVEGLELGAVDYLTKPINRSETLARIHTHLILQSSIAKEKASSEQFRSILNNLSECVLVVDEQGEIVYTNPAGEHLFGYSDEELIGSNFSAYINLTMPPDKFIRMLMNSSFSKDSFNKEVITGKRKNSDEFPISIHLNQLYIGESYFVVIIQDITWHQQQIDSLHHLTHTDALTHVGNRRYFEETLKRYWRQHIREKQQLAILFIDIDNFKKYNDQYGHQKGDHCLRMVAKVLSKTLSRPHDILFRYGGEEFTVLLLDSSAKGAITVAENLRHSVEKLQLTHLGNTPKVVTISIGVATTITNNVSDSYELLKKSDDELFRAKDLGRNRVEPSC